MPIIRIITFTSHRNRPRIREVYVYGNIKIAQVVSVL